MRIRRKLKVYIFLLVLLTLAMGVLAYPKENQLLKMVGINTDLKVRLGLDLQGGVSLTYQAKIPDGVDGADALKQTAAVIERRVNPGGVSEAIVQTAENNRVVVQLPDEDDPEAAKKLIGRTAQLQFYEVNTQAESPAQQIIPTEISGQDVDSASADFDQFNRPIVSLRFKSGESTDKFAAVTERVSQNGTLLLTLLDGQTVFGPANVAQAITTGEAQLSGNFTVKQAQETATLLNAGALPVPVELVAQQTVGPTLGAESLKQSLIAAIIGLLSLAAFMVINYRLGGLVAVATIIFYSVTMVALFKLSAFTPYVIVLTLAGIAGFILSVAVAADFNVLILERIREERRHGATPVRAVESGFNHAWSSIRDAAAATIISSIILYVFGSPIVRGFALTLGLGVALSVFSALFSSKSILRVIARTSMGDKL